MSRGQETLDLSVDTAAFDEWVAALRLLVGQIGFALDNYLASRPRRED